MARTLLQIVQATQSELGLPVSLTVIGNTDQTTVQMLALVQAEIEELRRRHDWTDLQREYNIITQAPVTINGDVANNSTIISNLSSTAGLTANYFMAFGANIPLGARILNVIDSTTIELSMAGTGPILQTPILFSKDTYPEPVDFDHFISDTWWDRTNHWRLLGPTSPQDDQWHRSGIYATGPRKTFRQIGSGGNNYRIWPAPSATTVPNQLVFEYISKYAIMTASGALAEYYTSDTDTSVLDDRIIIMGLKWRIWAQKGFAWASLRTEYDNYIERQIARDGGASALYLGGGRIRNDNTIQSGQDVNFVLNSNVNN